MVTGVHMDRDKGWIITQFFSSLFIVKASIFVLSYYFFNTRFKTGNWTVDSNLC